MPPERPVGGPLAAFPAQQSAAAAAPGAVPAPAVRRTPGPTGALPAVCGRPPLPPGLRFQYHPNDQECRHPLRLVGTDAVFDAGGESATSQASAVGAGSAPTPGRGPTVVPQ